jgi:hypothetical protein
VSNPSGKRPQFRKGAVLRFGEPVVECLSVFPEIGTSNYLQILSGNVQQSPTPTTSFTPEHFLQGTPSVVETPRPRRFDGSAHINPVLMATNAGVVMEEVVKHLAGILGAKVNVTLEIEVASK